MAPGNGLPELENRIADLEALLGRMVATQLVLIDSFRERRLLSQEERLPIEEAAP